MIVLGQSGAALTDALSPSPPTADPAGDEYKPIGPRFASISRPLQFSAYEDHFTLEFAGAHPPDAARSLEERGNRETGSRITPPGTT
ncbi:hypothetical protein ACFU5W_30695 [Streptomyces laurentii]|uniref:hypothetical protein n=1 Tax=Streptomyces laurentii TaxID=39478 RepID=UPI003685BAC9